jgi:hypothetical protein
MGAANCLNRKSGKLAKAHGKIKKGKRTRTRVSQEARSSDQAMLKTGTQNNKESTSKTRFSTNRPQL